MNNSNQNQKTVTLGQSLSSQGPDFTSAISVHSVQTSRFSNKEKTSIPHQHRVRRFNKSLWTVHENRKYVEFLQQNRNMFQTTMENRRLCKINKLISLFVKTRSPDQCRSHHQKMIKYHMSVEGIIQHVYQLENLYEQIIGERKGKIALRIRNKTRKSELQQISSSEQENKSLWDVLCNEERFSLA